MYAMHKGELSKADFEMWCLNAIGIESYVVFNIDAPAKVTCRRAVDSYS